MLPDVIEALVTAQQALKEHYEAVTNGRLEFTLDGNLVGDIGEALAIEEFGLELQGRCEEGVDGVASGRTVQVKATGTGRGPAFRRTRVDAEHLLFFQIDFANCRARVIYNGPEAPVRLALGDAWVGQRSLSLRRMEDLNRMVLESERLPFIRRS